MQLSYFFLYCSIDGIGIKTWSKIKIADWLSPLDNAYGTRSEIRSYAL